MTNSLNSGPRAGHFSIMFFTMLSLSVACYSTDCQCQHPLGRECRTLQWRSFQRYLQPEMVTIQQNYERWYVRDWHEGISTLFCFCASLTVTPWSRTGALQLNPKQQRHQHLGRYYISNNLMSVHVFQNQMVQSASSSRSPITTPSQDREAASHMYP